MAKCESSFLRIEPLIHGARHGDASSLNTLLGLYVNYLKLLSQTQLDDRVRRRVSASDVVQETLFEAHRDFHQFGGTSGPEFLGWLRKILVHNLARAVEQHVLAAKRDVRRELSFDQIDRTLNRSAARLEAVLADQAATPGSEAERQELLLRLADALACLTTDYREVIFLRHVEGLPFREVGVRMGRTEGATRMLWMRALDRLRETLDSQEV